MKQQCIAIIPARGGSKRVPRKNIRPFCGRPLIAYSISAALESNLFDAVVVSTDDPEIASISESCGAVTACPRPPELSDDHTGTLPVIAHAIKWWESNNSSVGIGCCIYATAPFLTAEDLRRGRAIIDEHEDAEFVFSVTSFSFPIFRALQIRENGTVGMFWPENELKRSQDLPPAWHDAGQFYWGTKNAFLSHEGFFSARSYPVPIPRYRVQDIDTMEDWACAERMFAAQAVSGVFRNGDL
jgi:pseudaminic acid cytidylyltransferase